MFPDVLLEQLPQNQLAQVCTTFRDWIYQKHKGPPVNLSWLQFNSWKYKSLDWDRVQFVVTKIDEELKKGNKEFLWKVWKASPEFLQICWRIKWCYWTRGSKWGQWPERSSLFQQLIQQENLELCTWILENMNFPDLDPEIAFFGIFREPMPYSFFRQIIFHNIRLGLGLERSHDTRRYPRPFWHRGFTMLKIVQNDDVELMKLYLDQRMILRTSPNLPPQPYQHHDYWVFQSYMHQSAQVLQIWRERGLHELPNHRKEELILLGRPEVLQFAIDQGIDLDGFFFFRMALKKSADKAMVLMKNYKLTWFSNLRAQDQKHLRGRLQNRNCKI